MSDILQIFSGNPLSTFIGRKIEAATRPDLEAEDWALNMEICDIVNENDEDAKDAVRAIKKRLQQVDQDPNFAITNKTLTVLETCVSNCSHRFHVHVMTKDFIQDLVKLIGPKNNPPINLQERVLRLIERWAEAFRSQPDLGGVVTVYNDLKAKGVTFPPRDPSSNVPIQTPQRSVPSPQPTLASANAPPATLGRLGPAGMIPQQHSFQQQQQQQQPVGQVKLEGEGYTKISQDLVVVQSSIEMFNDIMQVLESPQCDESDWKLAEDLAVTCRQMKDRIVDLIERVANEDLTIELLRLNDELNNIFTKYDRLVKNKSKSPSGSQQQTTTASSTSSVPTTSADPTQTRSTSATTTATSTASTTNQQVLSSAGNNRPTGVSSNTMSDLALIDFNASSGTAGESSSKHSSGPTTTASKLSSSDPFNTGATANLIGQNSGDESSRLLADNMGKLNLRTAGNTATASNSNNTRSKQPGGLPDEISSVREQDFAEIENWLATDSGRDLASIGGDLPSMEPISIPNSEFENFLANRALAGSNVTPSNEQQTQVKQQERKPEPSV